MSDTDEKLKNFMFFKLWVTDKERDEIFSGPWLIILLIVIILGAIGACVLG